MPDPTIIRQPAAPIYTIGHSTRSIDELLSLLEQFSISTLADIRRYPGSRRHPQFSSAVLADSVRTAGIGYRHLAELGGRRQSSPDSLNAAWRNESFRAYADYMATDAFRAAIDELLALPSPVAIMCAEAVPWRCHRNLVSDELTRRGLEVLHILGPATLRGHVLNPAAVERDGHLVYPAAAKRLAFSRCPCPLRYNDFPKATRLRIWRNSCPWRRARSAARRNSILAVDDNEQNLQLLEEYLWQWGYNVVVARDGREALELFPVHNPSLIVLDVMMPNIDGYEACARIKGTAQGRRIPIVMLTALTERRGQDPRARMRRRRLPQQADHQGGAADTHPLAPQHPQPPQGARLQREHHRRRSPRALENRTRAVADTCSAWPVRRRSSARSSACRIEDRETIVKGSLLHDLGMIGVSDAIAQTRQSRLNDEETEGGASTRRWAPRSSAS